MFMRGADRPGLNPDTDRMIKRLSVILSAIPAGLKEWRSLCGKLRNLAPARGLELGLAMYGAWAILRGKAPRTASGLATTDAGLSYAMAAVRRPARHPSATIAPNGPFFVTMTDSSDDAAGAVLGLYPRPSDALPQAKSSLHTHCGVNTQARNGRFSEPS